MAELGFTTYVQPAEPTPPTLAERFAELTGAQKVAILDGFCDKIIANDSVIAESYKRFLTDFAIW